MITHFCWQAADIYKKKELENVDIVLNFDETLVSRPAVSKPWPPLGTLENRMEISYFIIQVLRNKKIIDLQGMLNSFIDCIVLLITWFSMMHLLSCVSSLCTIIPCVIMAVWISKYLLAAPFMSIWILSFSSHLSFISFYPGAICVQLHSRKYLW